MPLTRLFKETVQARVNRDPEFRDALLQEAIEAMLEGDLDTGKALMRDCINATVGFEGLAQATGTPAKSLMRMFSPAGNPNARSLFSVIQHTQECFGRSIKVEIESVEIESMEETHILA
jgi:DNA-binding phage protein